jgi:hypothetical protein
LFALDILSVFAQVDAQPSQTVTSFSEFITKTDGHLEVSVVFPLAGLAIMTSSFLFNRSKGDNENKKHLVYAKENFIKAFFGLIICGIAIFVFDFLEIRQGEFVVLSFLDVLVTFGLFGYGMFYFIRGANGLRRSIL